MFTNDPRIFANIREIVPKNFSSNCFVQITAIAYLVTVLQNLLFEYIRAQIREFVPIFVKIRELKTFAEILPWQKSCEKILFNFVEKIQSEKA